MDVPSWHPANEDATLTRQLMEASAASAQRTEFKVMPGSMADTSTEAGRELLNELTSGADGGSAAVEGRGFFDSSDRLYLQEQKRLEAERLETKRQQDLEELRKFRSTALKVQAQKNAALVAAATDLPLDVAKKNSSNNSVPTVVIKAKKRRASDTNDTKTKSAKTHPRSEPQSDVKDSVHKTIATTSLVLGYSSSSDSDSDEKSTK